MTILGPSVVWFRLDLRLADNPAVQAALARGASVVPLFILDDETPGRWAIGGASRWWLHHSLQALARELEGRGAKLVLRRGPAERCLMEVIEEAGAGAVYWNRRYDSDGIAVDSRIKESLRERGLTAESFNAGLLHEPWTLRTKGGDPFKVFTPFWKTIVGLGDPEAPLPAPKSIPGGVGVISDDLEAWSLLPTSPDWAGGLRETWSPGEAHAKERLSAFLEDALARYGEDRNRPDLPQTSRLSPHLHWGEIGPRQVWHWTRDHVRARGGKGLEREALAFLRELGWREFSQHLLFHWPEFPDKAWKPAFEDFPWSEDAAGFEAWCRGQTGYPIVDAGMRELYATGWMHNRVRMVTASFLIKHLLVPWQQGEAWFWDTLVDADLGSNSASWQWVAGSGADAAPYFRIFNPVLQGEKFDPKGAYVRRWVPEIAALPDADLHKPWQASPEVLAAAGIELGVTYPAPIVDHSAARARALAAYETIKKTAA